MVRVAWKLKKAPECNEGGFQLTDRPPLGSLKVIPSIEKDIMLLPQTVGLSVLGKLKKAPECNEGGFQFTDRPPLGSLKLIPHPIKNISLFCRFISGT